MQRWAGIAEVISWTVLVVVRSEAVKELYWWLLAATWLTQVPWRLDATTTAESVFRSREQTLVRGSNHDYS